MLLNAEVETIAMTASIYFSTVIMMLSLLGRDSITKGLSIESRCFTILNVLVVAVAVKAITLTEICTKLQRFQYSDISIIL